MTSNVDEVTTEFIQGVVAGAADWSDVEFGKPGAVVFYVAEGDVPGLAGVLGVSEEELTASAEVLPDDELMPQILGDAAAFTLLPLEQVDTRGRSLAVDGVDVIRRVGDPGQYPFVSGYFVKVNGQGEHADIAEALARYLEEQAVPPDPIDILSVGDLIPARCVLANILSLGDVNAPFQHVKEKIESADLAFGTLDMQLTDAVQHQLCIENYVHTGPTELAEGIAWAGFDVIFNGTNHSMDGQIAGAPDAVQETKDAFTAAGIKTAGQGHNLKEAMEPVIVEVKGVRFGFTAADGVESYTWAGEDSPGTNPADPDGLGQEVKKLLKRADVVIATCECGIINGDAEYRNLPTDLQIAMAQNALDAGATEYIGGQSHWVQGAEFLGDKFIGYHMGNFVYDQDWSYETMHGAMLDSYYIGTRLVNVRYTIVQIEGMLSPRIVGPEDAQRTLDAIWGATPDVPGSQIAP